MGALLYLAVCTRPDIMTALSILGRFQANPSETHVKALKGVLKYIAGTTNHGLVYHKKMANEPLYGISDSDHQIKHSRKKYEQDRESCYPRAGYAVMRGGAAVIWSSKHLKGTVSSSSEAEYRAGSECVKRVIWAQELLKEVGFDTPSPTKIQIDNQSAIRMSMNVASLHKTQHIRTDEMQLTESFDRGDTFPEYIATDLNPADAFTKALGYKVFSRHKCILMGTQETFSQ